MSNSASSGAYVIEIIEEMNIITKNIVKAIPSEQSKRLVQT
jgi:uncharacterized FlaG/YvyC family protein